MENEKTTIESRVANAILEKKVGTIEIDGVSYEIAPPSLATLILVSEIVSTLPIVEKVPAKEVVNSVLHHAKDFKRLGELAAVMILGAKNLTRQRTSSVVEKRLCGLIRHRKEIVETIDMKSELAEVILQNVRPSVLWEILIKRLNDMEIPSFFSITTSLSEANLLKPTKEVV